MSDAFKRGTNYCTRMARMASGTDELASLNAILDSQQARCANGDHEVATVPATRVVYERYSIPQGSPKRRRLTGEQYCRSCDMTLTNLDGETSCR